MFGGLPSLLLELYVRTVPIFNGLGSRGLSQLQPAKVGLVGGLGGGLRLSITEHLERLVVCQVG